MSYVAAALLLILIVGSAAWWIDHQYLRKELQEVRDTLSETDRQLGKERLKVKAATDANAHLSAVIEAQNAAVAKLAAEGLSLRREIEAELERVRKRNRTLQASYDQILKSPPIYPDDPVRSVVIRMDQYIAARKQEKEL